MSTSPFLVLASAAAIGSAAVGGLFYAFSTFAMRGLDQTDAKDAITAMRGINAEEQANALFMLMFRVSAVRARAVGVIAAVRVGRPGSGYLIAGAVLAVLAAVVTIAFN